MDYMGLLITIGISVYGVLEYRRRERATRLVIECLNRGEAPPDTAPKPVAWKLVMIGAVAVPVLAMAVWLAWFGVWFGSMNKGIFLVAGVFFLLFLSLVRLFVRDLRFYREFHGTGRLTQ